MEDFFRNLLLKGKHSFQEISARDSETMVACSDFNMRRFCSVADLSEKAAARVYGGSLGGIR